MKSTAQDSNFVTMAYQVNSPGFKLGLIVLDSVFSKFCYLYSDIVRFINQTILQIYAGQKAVNALHKLYGTDYTVGSASEILCKFNNSFTISNKVNVIVFTHNTQYSIFCRCL